jgi:RNA polymerase sigma-70 factor (ECF subfamily)
MEAEQLLSISEGDEKTFLVLFKMFAPLIRPFARKITHSETSAEDIIQETFIRIWLYRDKLTEINNIKSWVFTVAAHECMRYMRQKLTYERKTGELLTHKTQPIEESPLDFVQINEINRIVQDVISAMPPQRKIIYQMSRDQGLKPAVIADRLDLSVGTVKNVLSRALKDIRKQLLQAGIVMSILIFHFFYFF